MWELLRMTLNVATPQTWVGVCVCIHISFISWTTLSLDQLTSGHTVRDHDGLVAWEAVCTAGD